MPLRSSIVVALSFVLLALAPQAVRGQDDVDPSDAGAVSVAVSGLDGPSGFIAGDDGALYVALAGHGGEAFGVAAPIPDSPILGGPTASVARIDEGCVTTLAADLPSARGATGRTFGATDLSVLDGQLYVLVAGGGASHGQPDAPNGVYRIDDEGRAELIADLSAWFRANPPQRPDALSNDPDGVPLAMAAVGEELWVVDANADQIVRVVPDGTITRLVDFSAARVGMSSIIPAPGGGAYVTAMGTPPYAPRTGSVLLVAPNRAVTVVWTRLTAPVGLTTDADGTLYAIESSTRNSVVPPFLGERAGRLIRQDGIDGRAVLVRGLDRPTSVASSSDGALFVALAVSEENPGVILRIALGSEGELTAPRRSPVGPACRSEVGRSGGIS